MGKSHPLLIGDGMRSAGSTMRIFLAQQGYEGKESKSICNGGRLLNCGSPASNWATWIGAITYLPGPDLWDEWDSEEMCHCVVGRAAVRTGGVIGPAYRVAVGQKPRAMAGTELGEGAAVRPW